MPADSLLREIIVPPPLEGLYDGLDPTLSDQLYAPTRTPDISNIRVHRGLWETRYGQSLFGLIGGSGTIRYLKHLYLSDGRRFRLAAQGNTTAGVLYDYEEGVDTLFQAVTGGTGLGNATYNLWNGVVMNDLLYLTDRQNALKKYSPATSPGTLTSITAVTAPSAAPLVKPLTYAVLDDWTTVATTWSLSGAANYEYHDDTATEPNPYGGKTIRLHIHNGAADDNRETFYENIANEALNSHFIAFWIRADKSKVAHQFQIGVGGPDEFSYPLKAKTSDDWYPKFIPVGDLPSINYKRFQCIRTFNGDSLWLSPLLLPGRLDGLYRWVYTHYDSDTGRESEPSPITNSGTPMDFSAIGVDNQVATARAMQKAAAMSFVTDSGSDATTESYRIYRNGGIPELTKDEFGRDLWFRVGTVRDFQTTLAAAALAAATTISLTATVTAGEVLVLEKGTSAKEEYVTVKSVAGGGPFTATLTAPLIYAHANGEDVEVAFIDNVPNEQVDTTASIVIERDPPPNGILWLARTPDGRLWAMGYSGKPTGVAVSNRPTPERPTDYETMPDGVDPLTRRDILQGWRFEVGGELIDEAITWGGLFAGQIYILTKRHLYVVHAKSQLDWGPDAVEKVLDLGCINGETVAEAGGYLYWVAAGPIVIRWRPGEAPERVSGRQVQQTLWNAPSAYWSQWHAHYHPSRDGHRYCLYMTPSGGTTNTVRLDLNTSENPLVWESHTYKNAASTTLGIATADVADSGSDVPELWHVATTGAIYRTDRGTTDDGTAIAIRAATKRFPLGYVSLIHRFYVRLAPVTDDLTVTVTVGGSEYGDRSHSYSITLDASTDPTESTDKEIKRRVHRNVKGRWVQLTLSGDVSNRPAIREVELVHMPWRNDRLRR